MGKGEGVGGTKNTRKKGRGGTGEERGRELPFLLSSPVSPLPFFLVFLSFPPSSPFPFALATQASLLIVFLKQTDTAYTLISYKLHVAYMKCKDAGEGKWPVIIWWIVYYYYMVCYNFYDLF